VRLRIAQLNSMMADADAAAAEATQPSNALSKRPVAVRALESLQRRIIRAADVDPATGQVILSVDDRIRVLKAELEELSKEALNEMAPVISQEEYETLLLRTATPEVYQSLLAAIDTRVVAAGSGGKVTAELNVPALKSSSCAITPDLQTLVSGSAFVSVCFADTLVPALKLSKEILSTLASEHEAIGGKLDFSAAATTLEGLRVREWACLQASYGVAAIPDLTLNFFKHIESSPEHWAPTYDVEAEAAHLAASVEADAEPEEKQEPVMYENFFSAKSIAEANSRYREVQDYNAS